MSLVAGRTGVPLFILFLQSVEEPLFREIHSLEQLEGLRERASDEEEKCVWRRLEAFFASGGSQAYTLAFPFPPKTRRLEAMLGRDGGPGRRTGVRLLLDWGRRADLLSIPQATELLDEEQLGFFRQTVSELIADVGVLYLADLPKSLSVSDAAESLRRFASPDTAAFFPWLINSLEAIPPSIAIAAWLQSSDHQIGVQELASDQPIGGNLKPMRLMASGDRAALLSARINTFLDHCGQTRVWGGYTLADKTDERLRLIPLRRTSVKLRQAAEEICEPFVLEAADSDLPVAVENRLQNFLRSVKGLFHQDAKEPFATDVKVVDQDGEEKIQVGLSYSLPHSYQRFSMSFVP